MYTQATPFTAINRFFFSFRTAASAGLLLLFVLAFGPGCDMLGQDEGLSPAERKARVPYEDLGDFFADQGAERQSFTISADSDQKVTGEKGLTLSVPADAFVDQEGNPVSGSVELTLEEIYSPAAMIQTNATTETEDGNPLITGGMFDLEARQNGQELRLDDRIRVAMPARTETGDLDRMNLWTSGRDSRTQPTDWTAVASGQERGFFLEEADSTAKWYTSIQQLGFLNCDVFDDRTPTSELRVELKGFTGDPAEVRAYVVNSDPTGVLGTRTDGRAFVRDGLPHDTYTVVVIGVGGGLQYFGSREVSLSGDQTVTVELAPTSPEALDEALSQL